MFQFTLFYGLHFSIAMCPCQGKVNDKGDNKKPSWMKSEQKKEPGLHMSPSSVSLG